MKTRGGPGRPRLTAQHVRSAGDQGAIARPELYSFRQQHTPSSIPPATGCCFLGEEGVFLGETRRGEAGPGTIDGTSASTVLHGSGCILLSFSAFSFLWLAAFVRT